MQGSAATRRRFGGQCGISFLANFVENATLKEFCVFMCDRQLT